MRDAVQVQGEAAGTVSKVRLTCRKHDRGTDWIATRRVGDRQRDAIFS